jgi:GntR family transcriptional regulator, galactonate operon transcriptional repressor
MTRLHRDPMRALLDEIVRGDIGEGDWLAKEVDLAQRFDVSRGVARETIRALEERGVVAVRHGRGARVRPIADWDLLDAEVLGALIGADRTGDVIGEALECRRLLEREAAASAAARLRPEGARALTESFAQLRAAAGAGTAVAAAVSEHRRTLARLAGNRPLARMLAPLDVIDAVVLEDLPRAAAKRLVERHDKVLAAVCAGDVEGARAAVDEDVAATAELVSARRRNGRRR